MPFQPEHRPRRGALSCSWQHRQLPAPCRAAPARLSDLSCHFCWTNVLRPQQGHRRQWKDTCERPDLLSSHPNKPACRLCVAMWVQPGWGALGLQELREAQRSSSSYCQSLQRRALAMKSYQLGSQSSAPPAAGKMVLLPLFIQAIGRVSGEELLLPCMT